MSSSISSITKKYTDFQDLSIEEIREIVREYGYDFFADKTDYSQQQLAAILILNDILE